MGNPAVLVVDDAADVRLLFRLSLEKAGFAVAGEAATGAEALALAGALGPGVVLVDLVLPDVDGLDLVGDLRALLPASRILVVSGRDDPGLDARCREAGADAQVVKAAGTDVGRIVRDLLGQPAP